MAQNQFKRKLTVTFSADVVGYSRLMAKMKRPRSDFGTLKADIDRVDPLTPQGRFFD